MDTTETLAGPPGSDVRRLTRPKDDRWLGGVAAGLGAYFDLSPTIYRIAFVALALAGGTGILLYVAAWLVIPEEGEAESIAAAELKKHRDRPRRLIGVAILAFAAILALSEARLWPSPGNLWLAVAIGLAAFAYWRLGPNAPARRRVAVLASVALLALIAAVTVFAVRVPLFAGIGHRVDTPHAAADVRSKYTLGIGNLTLDFSNVALPKGQTFVKGEVGIGKLSVIVPRNASVRAEGRAQVGDVNILGRHDSGTRVHSRVNDLTGSGRVVVLNLRTGLGKVTVTRG